MRLRRGSKITIDSERQLDEFDIEDAPPMATQPPSLNEAG